MALLETLITLAEGVVVVELTDQPDTCVVKMGEKYCRLTGLARQVVLAVAGSAFTTSELLARITDATNATATDSSAVLGQLELRGILHCAGSQPADNITGKLTNKRSTSYMQWRHMILNSHRVEYIAHLAEPLLSETLIRVSMPILIFFQLYCFYRFAPQVTPAVRHLNNASFFLLICLNYISLFVHEIGHAAACVRSRHAPGAIGVGLYLIFPVMYIDVGTTWLLPRRNRLLVDVGGIYFSSLIAGTAWLFFLITHAVVAGLLGFLVSITLIGNLNPFIRMDGYWFLSDALNVPNLMALNKAMVSWVCSWFLRKPKRFPGGDLDNTLTKVSYYVYFVGFLLFSLYLAEVTVLKIIPGAMRASIAQWQEMLLMRNGSVSVGHAIRDGLGTVFILIPILSIVLLVARPLIRALADYLQQSPSDNAVIAAGQPVALKDVRLG